MNTRWLSSPVVGTTDRVGTHFYGGTQGDNDESSGKPTLAKLGLLNAPAKQGALKFFLVEDNAITRENLAETLHEMVAAEVVGVADAQGEAILWLSDPTHQWDVAVVAIFLKSGNGIQVIASLQTGKRQRKIVVLSNYASPEVRRECLRLGADAVFDKSTELDDLIEFCSKVKLH